MNLVKAILSKDPKAAKLAFEARMRPFVAHVMSTLYVDEAKGFITESNSDAEFVAKYNSNEDSNNHAGNALLAAKRFGNYQEVQFISGVLDRIEKDWNNGRNVSVSDNRDEYDKINAIHSKYYPQINKLLDGLNEARSAECECASNFTCGHCLRNAKPYVFTPSTNAEILSRQINRKPDCCVPTSTGHHAEDCQHWLGGR